MPASPSFAWYRRRPCFWLALAAGGGAGLAAGWPIPAWAWLLAALLSLGLAFTRARTLTPLPLALALCAGWTASRAALPAGPQYREGAQVTLRGTLAEVGPPGERSRRAVLSAHWRSTLQGWVKDRRRWGIRVPLTAREGDLAEVSGIVRVPLPPTNPGGYNERLAWLRRDVRLLVKLRPKGYLPLGHRPRAAWREGSLGVRERVFAANRRTLRPEAAFIANQFLLGETEPEDPEAAEQIATAFRDSGTIHLLVVSGTQVMLVLGVFLWCGRRWWRLRHLFWSLALVGLAGFYLLTAGDGSVVRAALVGVLLVGALLFTREPGGENCLGFAALGLLAANPFSLFDIGAQLSFAAVWALLRLAAPLAEALGPAEADGKKTRDSFLRQAHRGLAVVLGTAIAAHLGTAPLVALHFQRSAWFGILANLPMGLLGFLFLYVALAHAFLGLLGIAFLAPVVELLASGMHGWAALFSRPPWGAADVLPVPVWVVLPFLAALALPSFLRLKRWGVFLTTAGLAAGLFFAERLPAPPPQAPMLRAMDVGQGDALLLQAPDGTNVLVDTGPPPPSRGGVPLLRALRSLRVTRLDAVFISHPHLDHIGGLAAVLDSFPVRRVIHNADRVEEREAETWKHCLETAARRRVPLQRAEAGGQLRLGGSTFTVLGPLPRPGAPPPEDLNETSLVLRWEYGPSRFLLTGDAGNPSELALLEAGAAVQAQVLKIGHHGSRTATGEAWLRAVHPACAVLSCGRDNRYGHPTPETLGRLQAQRIPTYRTDQSGMVTLKVRNGQVFVEQFVK